MPRLTQQLPKYRKHRASGQAVVTLAGVDHYLGKYGTKVSRIGYDRLIAEWLAGGRAITTETKQLSTTFCRVTRRDAVDAARRSTAIWAAFLAVI